jgi:hypothetical protein
MVRGRNEILNVEYSQSPLCKEKVIVKVASIANSKTDGVRSATHYLQGEHKKTPHFQNDTYTRVAYLEHHTHTSR